MNDRIITPGIVHQLRPVASKRTTQCENIQHTLINTTH